MFAPIVKPILQVKYYYTQPCMLLLMVVCFCLRLPAQSIKNYVEQHTLPVQFIENRQDDAFADLEAFGNAVGDSRIVLLGEQDHGDAPTFLAKTRLVKYLHEKKGFDVLAFESDFFALNYAWDKLEKQQALIDSFLMRNIFPIWTFCDACENLLYSYIPSTFNTNAPLQVSGFDNQMILDYSWHHLSSTLDSFLRANNFPAVHAANYDSLLSQMDRLRKFSYLNDSGRNALRPEMQRAILAFTGIQQQADSLLAKDDFWLMVIHSYMPGLKQLYETNYAEQNTIRDEQMAKNLAWLCKVKYPDKKIIVWAASAHIQKGADVIQNKFDFINMGLRFINDTLLKKETYFLGFTSATGTAGRLTMKDSYKVAKPLANSFEKWVNEDYAYAFTDFSAFNNQYPGFNSPFLMKGTRHYYIKRVWNKAFDGVFFIRNMYPCKNIFKQVK